MSKKKLIETIMGFLAGLIVLALICGLAFLLIAKVIGVL